MAPATVLNQYKPQTGTMVPIHTLLSALYVLELFVPGKDYATDRLYLSTTFNGKNVQGRRSSGILNKLLFT
jgi:hypothetical protein